MNRFHCILLMVILFFVGFALASDSNSVAATSLRSGYFDITDLSDDRGYSISHTTLDSIDGVYLYIESGWDGPCCTSPYYTRFSIGKNLNSKQNDSIWVLTDFSDIELLNSELKKGNPLTLEDFTKLDFDSTRVQYLIHGTNKSADIKKRRDILEKGYKDYFSEDSLEYLNEQEYLEYLAYLNYLNSFPDIYFTDYFLYKRDSLEVALCGVVHAVCAYKIGCFYQNDGSFVFDSLPNPSKMVSAVGCPDGIGTSLIPMNRSIYKSKKIKGKLYKVNGTPATKSSSNIIIQNKKQKLQLKGNKK